MDTINKPIGSEIIESFHQMWDAFPGPVRLIDKTHTVEKARDMGFIEGVKCSEADTSESHSGLPGP